MNRVLLMTVILGLIGLVPTLAADPSSADASALVRQLNDDDFDKRQAAEEALVQLGAAAIASLREAARSDDPETAFRADRALRAIELAVPPGTPPDVAKLLHRYRIAQPNEQQILRYDLFLAAAQAGKSGGPVIRALAARLAGQNVEFSADILMAVHRAVPPLLLAGKDDEAEAVLEVATEVGPLSCATDYAMFQFDRGRAAQALAKFEPRCEGTTKEAEAARWVVFQIDRARGDADKALAAVTGITNTTTRAAFRTDLLADAGRWGELADAMTATTGARERLTLLRLAGRTAELEKLATELRAVRKEPAKDAEPAIRIVQAFLLVGRPADADQVAANAALGPVIRLQIAAMRNQMADALALPGGKEGVAALQKEKLDQWIAWQSERVKLLARLGRVEEAIKVVDEIAAAPQVAPVAQPGMPVPRMRVQDSPVLRAIRELYAAGLTDQAYIKAGKFMDEGPRNGAGWYQVITALYNPQGTNQIGLLGPQMWWAALRASIHQEKAPSETLALIRKLISGTATKEEYEAARQAMKTAMEQGQVAHQYTQTALLDAAIVNGHPDDAEAMLREQAEATFPARPNVGRGVKSWLDWGKFLSARGKHKEAAAAFYRGWERYPDSASLLYQSGRALIRTDDVAEGKRRIAVAFRTPLASESEWMEFSAELIDGGGAVEDRTRAGDALGRLCRGQITNRSVMTNRRSIAYRWGRSYAAAAKANDVALYTAAADPNYSFQALSGYLRLYAQGEGFRAIALAQAGKPKEAVAFAKSYLKLSPGEVLFVVDLIPLLDQMGAKAEAEEVFRATLAPLQALLKEYPDSPLYNNQAAWLSATARRELDAALLQARRATTLAPENAGYRDTLAEVLFRRGDKAGAIAIMQKLAERSVGRRSYYQAQLNRFRAGDITVPPPDEF